MTGELATANFRMVPLASIVVHREERQRRTIDTTGLKDSIAKRGILVPLVVRAEGETLVLVAGERRWTSAKELGLAEVPVRFYESLDLIEAQIIELEENIKREDLEWQDLVRAVARVHALHLSGDLEWTQGETADSIGLTSGVISMYLRVHRELGEERISAAGTVREAYNLLLRRDARAQGEVLQSLLEVTPKVPAPGLPTLAAAHRTPSAPAGAPRVELNGLGAPAAAADPSDPRAFPLETPTHVPAEGPSLEESLGLPAAAPAPSIQCANFLEWAAEYDGPKFNLIHCDFPYGVGLFSGPQGSGSHESYDDTPNTYRALLEGFCEHFGRFASVSAHVVFWFSEKHRDYTLRIFAERLPDLQWAPFPLIWHKSDNAGIAGDSRRHPRHVYETALLGIRGQRQLVQVAADFYAAPTDKTLHASTKPEPMLRHFFKMLVDEGTRLFDPTCGSGAALRAAESLGASQVLGLELDEDAAQRAQQALHNFRLLRSLGK